MNLAGFSSILKVHSTKTSGLRTWQAACEQKFCILDTGSVFKDYYLHRVRSLEEKLEDLASLSLNHWLTKFVQEIANKNEIVNSAIGMFTELKKRNWQCSWLIMMINLTEVLFLCVQFVLFWSINLDVQWRDRWKPRVVLICDPKYVWFSSVFSLGIKTNARDEFGHFYWLSNLWIINEFEKYEAWYVIF